MSAAATDFKAEILKALETMYNGELALNGPQSRFKASAYKKASRAITALSAVHSLENVRGLDGIGVKIMAKIEEIIQTGKLCAADRMKERTDVEAYETLLAVHGVGPVKARALLSSGIRTIEALRSAALTNPKLLTAAQAMGVKHYEDGLLRIPRPEMLLHEALLLRLSAAVGLSGCLVGSFRRGAADSGDIDVLLTYPPSMSLAAAQRLFHMYILALKGEIYVTDELVHGDKKWMGYVKLGSGAHVRRLDLLLTPPEEYAYSILYFTGSDKFNIAMRRHSLSLGYSLNEHGITRIAAPAAPAAEATAIALTREEDIFAFLGLRYVPPTERKDEAQIKKI